MPHDQAPLVELNDPDPNIGHGTRSPAGGPCAGVIHRPGFGDVALQGAADEFLGKPGALDELLQVHPRLDPHLVENVDQILAGVILGSNRL